MINNDLQNNARIEIYSLSDSKKQQIDMAEWSYLSQGSYHIVFMNSNQHSKWRNYVLFLCKRQPHTGIDSEINNHYLAELSKSQLGKFIVKSEKYSLSDPQNDGPKFEQLIKKNIKSGSYQCDLKDNYQFTLSENLFSGLQQYDIVAEVKTKTITPDIYLMEMLQKIAQDRGIDVKQIQYQLQNSDPIQKTKWFKSKIAFNKRQNDSSFHYYGLSKFTNLNFVFDCLQSKKGKVNKQVYAKQEMNTIFAEQLRKSGLLRTIHDILSSVNEPKSLKGYPNYQQYNKLPIKLPNIMSQIKSNKNIENFEQQYKILQQQCCHKQQRNQQQMSQEQIEQQKWVNLYKYLIFTCISDMSIVGKIKIDPSTRQAVGSQFKLLDYQLIPLKHVSKRIAKYQSVFDRFLDYKGLRYKYGKQHFNKQLDMQKQISVINQHTLKQLQNKNEQHWKEMKSVKIQKTNNKINLGYNLFSSYLMPNIIYLDLSLNRLQLQHIKLLSKNNWKYLQNLNLDSNYIDKEGSLILSGGNWPSLKTLKLNYNKLGDEGIFNLSKSNWVLLQHLELNWNNMTQAGIKYLQTWPKLTKISLVENHLRDKGALKLNEIKLPNLKEINIWQNAFSLTGIKSLSQTSWIFLQKMVLGGNHINDEGLNYISLGRWPNLEVLDFTLNQIEFVFSHRKDNLDLQNMFQFPKLQQLRLGTNKIRSEGAYNISKLSISKHLIFLDLYSNTIEDKGFMSLCDTTWPKLKHLNVCMCEIGDKSIELLTQALFPELSYLLMLRDNVTIKGLSKLLREHWQFLQKIDIRGNKVSKKQYEEFKTSGQNKLLDSLENLSIVI